MRDACWQSQLYAAVVLITRLFTAYSQNGHSAPMISSISSTPPQYYPEGSNIYLRCSADGSPVPRYSWLKDDALTTYVNQTSGDWTILAARANATGYYQCLARNTWGATMSNVVHLQMRSLGDFSDVTTLPQQALAGSQVEIVCRGRPESVPPSTYTWAVIPDVDTAPNGNLGMDNRRQIDPTTGSLHISYVIANDSSQANPIYACGAGIPGTTKYGSYVNFAVSGTDTNPRLSQAFRYPPSNPVLVLEGQTADIKCFFYGNPIPSVTWTGLQPNDTRVSILASGTELRIANVTQDDDQGTGLIITCTGVNTYRPSGLTYQFSISVQVIPVFNETNMGPVLTYGTIGQPATFYCDPAARPQATLTWYVNGVQLTDPVPAKYSLSDDRRNLTINNVTAEDSMVVNCKAANVYGAVVGAGELRVVQLTQVTGVPSDVSAAAGQSAMFTCSGWADPLTTLSFLWLYNGTEINYTSNVYATSPTSSSSELHIARVSDVHAGVYTCRATNTHSYSDSPDVYLTVLPPIVPFDIASIWYVFLIIGLLLLIFLLFLCLFCYCKDNEGDSYPVDEIEKKHGNDPVSELTRTGIQSYQSSRVVTAGYGADATGQNFSPAGGYPNGPEPIPYAVQDNVPPAYAVPNAGYIPTTAPSTLQRGGYPAATNSRSRPQTPRSLNAMPYAELAAPIPRTGTPGDQLAINPWAASPVDDPRNQPMTFSSFQPINSPTAGADGYYQPDFDGQGQPQYPQMPADEPYAREDVYDPRIPSRGGPTPIRSPLGAHGYDHNGGGYGPGPAVGPYGGDLMGRFTPNPVYTNPAGGPAYNDGFGGNPYAFEMAVEDRAPSESSV